MFDDDLLGRVVIATAGRDKGKIFSIVKICDDGHVFIADGKIRKIHSPKKKKMKHLFLTETILDKIKTKIIENVKIIDAEMRKALEVIRRNL